MKGLFAQPKYPPMERQDLTQGQLGSFKFTPIDVPPSSTLGDTPLLLAAQAQLRARLNSQASSQPVTADNKINFSARASQQRLDDQLHKQPSTFDFSVPPTLPPATSRPNPDFFNTHIKNDLEDSRLKLGTAAFRAAIVGNSPEKSLSQVRSRAESNATNLRPSSTTDKSMFTMNPKAMSFDPVVSPSDDTESTVMLSYKSLVRCLEGEQERHQQTKATLAQVLVRVKELEAEAKKLEADKRSLAGSVKLLVGIVQHNKDRLEKREVAMTEEAVVSINGEDEAVLQNRHNGEAKEIADTQVQTPIKSRVTDDPFITNGTVITPPTGQDNSDVDHARRFNLELLKSGQSADTPASRRSRALRDHFNIPEVAEDSPDETVDGMQGSEKTTREADMLRSTTNKVDDTPTKMGVKTSHTDADLVQAISIPEASTTTSKKYPVPKLQTSDDPVLTLPAHFLNKYQKPSVNGDSVKPEPDEKSLATESHGKPSISLAPSLHSLNALATKTIDPAAPYELSIKWIVNQENPIFDDEEDHNNRIRWISYYARSSVFWKHPVRYLAHDSKNLFRTVMIDYIPAEADYIDVLGVICAGSLEKVELVPAIGCATNYKTARVVFNFELGASTTANFARDHGLKIKGQPVRVWQVLTQTYPKNNKIDNYVFEDGFTRMLIINNASDQALSKIPTLLASFKTSIVDFCETFDQYPLIEFTSVAAAVGAMQVLMANEKFHGAQFDFDEDPCGRFGQDGAAMKDW